MRAVRCSRYLRRIRVGTPGAGTSVRPLSSKWERVLAKNVEHVTFCTGYWVLSGNRKRPIEHYLDHIPKSLKLISGGKLVLFYDDPMVEETFRRLATGERIDFTGVKVPLGELPTARYGNAFLAACRGMNLEGLRKLPRHRFEKGLRHYERDLLGSGENVYRNLISIWTSKVPLMRRVADSALYDTNHYAWIDASISRFNQQRHNWDFTGQEYGELILVSLRESDALQRQNLAAERLIHARHAKRMDSMWKSISHVNWSIR